MGETEHGKKKKSGGGGEVVTSKENKDKVNDNIAGGKMGGGKVVGLL